MSCLQSKDDKAIELSRQIPKLSRYNRLINLQSVQLISFFPFHVVFYVVSYVFDTLIPSPRLLSSNTNNRRFFKIAPERSFPARLSYSEHSVSVRYAFLHAHHKDYINSP